MLSYLHGFHAGNHADVFKHAVLTLALDALMAKPKPLVYLDSHAGVGVYDLAAPEASKTGEFADGIGRLWRERGAFAELASYFGAIAALNPDGGCRHYPGSPQLARHCLRADDRLILMELHKTEAQRLRAALRADPRVNIHHRDGFEALPALLPPRPPRGLVLIDPPYEVKTDYEAVARAFAAAYARWPTGVYLIWYPRLAVQRDRADHLLRRLLRTVPRFLVAELAVQAQADDVGMHGSGVALVNPPWQLDERLTQLLPRLAAILAAAPAKVEAQTRPAPRWCVQWREGAD
ncbi:23S rRNA (adenine(2030)-N(6))-methyltransferase RlmJ [Thiocystis violacea]|uniref:23S rRNA (adenine(2030)-N(6))-methyltransferase RlmJ n=1 Tax=Thiocystis violacea TaxID=13725 RepID=UPI0019082CF6|nr:23S rRNA (adenine(2030)-N(6))-methyltransferase RlmJ [Thiocystis violacea]MBK1721819.1 23S rRNA (adenine(2030)-N(6))-methyltransferase RlmJ [Thiocystis violacea]